MLPLCESHRVRCVAVDRRGFGKSDWSGAPHSVAASINYGTFAKDTIHVLEELDLEEIVFVAASMGCGETLLAYLSSEWVRERCRVRIPTTPVLDTAEKEMKLLMRLITSTGFHLDGCFPSVSTSDTNKSAGA